MHKTISSYSANLSHPNKFLLIIFQHNPQVGVKLAVEFSLIATSWSDYVQLEELVS
jgi:hypothetical protein